MLETMRAMTLEEQMGVGELPLRMRDWPVLEPGEKEIRLRVKCCGVCHTDLHTIEGDLAPPALPLIPGHQVVGLVDLAGPGAGRFRQGDRVGVPWLYQTCGRCGFCVSDRENLCDRARFTGLDVNGGYAEYMIVGEDYAYELPPTFSDIEVAPLLCAGIIGYRALRLSEIRPGGRLGLYGFGASAHIAIQIAHHWQCEVYVFTRSEEHRRLAIDLGAAWVGRAEDEPPGRIDAGVVFAPAGGLVPDVLRVLEKGGTVSLAGIYMSPIPSISYDLLYSERTVRSVANSTRQDARELLALADEIPIQTEVEAFRLEEANRVLVRLKESRVQGAAVLTLD